MSKFGRVYRLVVGKAGGTGLDIEALRITFDISKSATSTPNTSKVTVYNVNPQHRAMLELPDTKLILYAGYVDDGGAVLMHSGDVVYSYTKREGSTFATELQLGDGHVALRDTMVTVSIPPGQSATSGIRTIAQELGASIYMGKNVLDREFANGYSYYGPARTALTQLCAATGLEWSVQNGVLQVINRGGTTFRQALSITSDSGLIQSPERLREGARESAVVVDQASAQKLLQRKTLIGQRLRYNGWKISSLLCPSLNPGDSLSLNPLDKKITHVYRVQKLSHRGDSQEGEWKTEMDLLDPNDYAVATEQRSQKVAKAAAAAAKKANKVRK